MNVEPDVNLWSYLKESFEGFRTNAYLDSGKVWTIGFGSTYNHDKKRKVTAGDVIDRVTALVWMKIDSTEVIRQANLYIKVKLLPGASTAICDYIYNRGIDNFLRTQLDELINANADTSLICNEIIKTGLKDKLGNLLWGLGRRRRAQAYLYKTGRLKLDFSRWEKINF